MLKRISYLEHGSNINEKYGYHTTKYNTEKKFAVETFRRCNWALVLTAHAKPPNRLQQTNLCGIYMHTYGRTATHIEGPRKHGGFTEVETSGSDMQAIETLHFPICQKTRRQQPLHRTWALTRGPMLALTFAIAIGNALFRSLISQMSQPNNCFFPSILCFETQYPEIVYPDSFEKGEKQGTSIN
jgi:hypothetical protein